MENVKNSVRLSGFAGSDPEIKYFGIAKKMAKVSMGISEFYKNGSGESVGQNHWFNLVFWNAKVDLVEDIVRKGTKFSIEGKLNTNTYTDKKGEKRVAIDIFVNSLELLDN